MDLAKSIDFLLLNAGVSIKYRIMREVLKTPINTPEMIELQSQIIKLPKIQKTFACQKENGFFGNVIHGGFYRSGQMARLKL